MKLKEIAIYIISILVNIGLGYLLTILMFSNEDNFTFVACGVILLSTIIDLIIANKFNYKLDIFAYDISDLKLMILNSIFIGNLFSVPVVMFLSMAL